jgi:hypothetical protein
MMLGTGKMTVVPVVSGRLKWAASSGWPGTGKGPRMPVGKAEVFYLMWVAVGWGENLGSSKSRL